MKSGEVNALGHRLPGGGKPVVQEAAGGLARQYDIQVSADGIHAPILMQYATITSYPSVAGSEPDFVVTAASNGWNLDGFKAARIVPGQEAVDPLAPPAEREGRHPRHLALIAYTAAIAHGQSWINSRALGLGDDPTATFLTRGRVALSSGTTFGEGVGPGTSGSTWPRRPLSWPRRCGRWV